AFDLARFRRSFRCNRDRLLRIYRLTPRSQLAESACLVSSNARQPDCRLSDGILLLANAPRAGRGVPPFAGLGHRARSRGASRVDTELPGRSAVRQGRPAGGEARQPLRKGRWRRKPSSDKTVIPSDKTVIP